MLAIPGSEFELRKPPNACDALLLPIRTMKWQAATAQAQVAHDRLGPGEEAAALFATLAGIECALRSDPVRRAPSPRCGSELETIARTRDRALAVGGRSVGSLRPWRRSGPGFAGARGGVVIESRLQPSADGRGRDRRCRCK